VCRAFVPRSRKICAAFLGQLYQIGIAGRARLVSAPPLLGELLIVERR